MTLRLIGDDEHGWSEYGIFNFEGGCYAKCINLSREKEPQIWDSIRYGAIMEKVVVDPETRFPDYSDARYTENTRVGYPVEFIPNALIPGMAGHPQVVIFLTADAFGVMPPVAKLDWTSPKKVEALLCYPNSYCFSNSSPSYTPVWNEAFLSYRIPQYRQKDLSLLLLWFGISLFE